MALHLNVHARDNNSEVEILIYITALGICFARFKTGRILLQFFTCVYEAFEVFYLKHYYVVPLLYIECQATHENFGYFLVQLCTMVVTWNLWIVYTAVY